MKLLVAALALAVVSPADAQPRGPRPPPGPPIDAAVRAQVIDGAIAALRRLYVFPDVAAKLETTLRERVKAHAYDRVTEPVAFAELMTKELQAVSHDKHMRMAYSPEPVPNDPPPDAAPSADEIARMHARVRQLNGGFVKVERLAGNIGYLRLDYFLPGDEVGARAAAAMTLVADSTALILDLRDNHGGEPGTVALIVSYLYDAFADVHINDIYDRPSDSTRQYWSLPHLPGPRFANKPVYVLTSNHTFSGGEECAYDLQTLKRATLIGEVTGGGANPGGDVKVADHFALFVPTGRAVNPVTKTNWEGVGVKPDIATPAAKALDTAYLAALRVAQKQVDTKATPRLAHEIDDAIAALSSKK